MGDCSAQSSLQGSEMMEKLQKIQEDKGYIPEEDIVAISKEYDVPLARLYGIITFYSFFRLKPGAKHKVQVCDGTACHVQGSEKIINNITDKLDSKIGEVTKDGQFTVEVVRCLGMCASAPIVKVDEKIHPKVDPDSIAEEVIKYKE